MKINIWGPEWDFFCFGFLVATSRLLYCDPSLPGKLFVLAKIVAREIMDSGLFTYGKKEFYAGKDSHQEIIPLFGILLENKI